MRAKKFRDDLYYRVSTLTLRIPPLRERAVDIPVLATAILRVVCNRMGRAEVQLSPAAGSAMQEYGWPGNIRELANVLERALILQKGDCLDAPDLGLGVRRVAQSAGDGEMVTLKEMERLHIERVLQRSGGSVTEAAAILGVARRTLYDRIKALGLAKP